MTDPSHWTASSANPYENPEAPTSPAQLPLQRPAELGNLAPPMQPLMVLGDMTVTPTQVITPSGTFAVANAQWSVTDMSTTTKRMSQTGLVLALVGFFLVCVLSLFFLLMTETQTTGYIQVCVTDGTRTHIANIPATSPESMNGITAQVNYARSLAAYL